MLYNNDNSDSIEIYSSEEIDHDSKIPLNFYWQRSIVSPQYSLIKLAYPIMLCGLKKYGVSLLQNYIYSSICIYDSFDIENVMKDKILN